MLGVLLSFTLFGFSSMKDQWYQPSFLKRQAKQFLYVEKLIIKYIKAERERVRGQR